MFKLEESLVFNAARASKMFILSFNKHFVELGVDITIEQFGVLYFIHRLQESIQQDLANLLDKDKSAILRTIDILERKGYVLRIPDKDDRRKNIIQSTDRAEEVIRRVLPSLAEYDSEILQGIEPDKVLVTIEVLSKIQQNIKCNNL